jgi:hypothetical protein
VRIAAGPKGELSAETSALSESPEAPFGASGECGEGSVEVSAVSQKIVEIAQHEVGYTGEGGFCTKFGPCEEWCSLFLTWVWEKAGVKVPSIPFTGALYDWGREHTHVYPASTRPQPGWGVLFGTGPESASTSLHVAIIEKVLPDGQIVIINGDYEESVMRTGPCQPSQATDGCEAPGPIYAYVTPT